MVEIFLLGRVSVVVDGSPLKGEAAQKRRLALLALLADPPLRVVGRDHLMLHLWPDSDMDSARHLLSSALHVLRKALGSDVIRLSGDQVELDRRRVRVDAVDFDAAAADEDWERAVELYGGPFLETFGASVSPEFEQWLDRKRDELARQYARSLDGLAEAREREERREDAMELRRRLVVHDPFNGAAVLELMRMLADAGDRGGALQVARSHAELLDAEFGAAPDPAVTGFAERLRAQPGDVALQPPRRGRAGAGQTAATPAPPAGDLPTGALPGGLTAAVAAVTPARARTKRRGRRSGAMWRAAALLAAVALAVGAYTWLSAGGGDVLAVIPRAAPGDADALDYLSFGVAETIDYQLGRSGARMLNSGSAFLYRDSIMDPREIGRHLEADLLITVSARSASGAPRIRVELLRTRDGRRLWQKQYHEERVERVARDAIAEVGRLIGVAPPLEPVGGRRTMAVSPEVYDLYQRGRFQWSRRTPQSLRAAVSLLTEAVARDSSYAWAHVALADVYNMMGSYDYGVLPPDSAFPLAKAAAERALELEPLLAPALVARAVARMNHDWDWAAAESDFRRAIQLNPGYTPAREWLAYLLIATGRMAEAEEELLGALTYNPSSALILADLAHLEYYRGDYARAHDYLDRAGVAYPPGFERIYVLRALLLCATGTHEKALELLEPMAAARRQDDPLLAAMRGYALAGAGQTEEAEAEAAWLASHRRGRFIPPEYFALIEIGLGKKERAIDELEAAAAHRSNAMLYLGIEPLLGPLRGHPRFERLVAAVGAVDAHVGG